MDQIIKIKCPFCGAILSVKNQPGIETKSVTCPVCKHKHPFTDYTTVSEPPVSHPDGERTRYNTGQTQYNTGQTQYNTEQTQFNSGHTRFGNPNLSLGTLTVQGGRQTFRLKPGRNVIGRKSSKSDADIQIETGGQRLMSREHILIDVKQVPGKGFVHYASLCKEKVNKTCVGNSQLFYGDCVVLNDGDMLRLPGVDLLFRIQDLEQTIF